MGTDAFLLTRPAGSNSIKEPVRRLGHSGPTIFGFMHPSDPTRTKIPSFESAYEIVLTDAKFITKQQYSSDLWPLKVKRNCIVDN
jgi:hypothetical protein